MKPADCHTHLYDKSFDHDLDKVIERAKKLVSKIIVVGEDAETNRKVLALCKTHKGFLLPGLAIHPDRVHLLTDEEVNKEIEFIRKQKDLVCIGECGLDWLKAEQFAMANPSFKMLEPKNFDFREAKQKQIGVFRKFIRLANEMGLALNVHSRRAEKDTIAVLKEEKAEKVLMHGFSGTIKEAEEAVLLGYKIAIGTTIFYSKQKVELVKAMPIEDFVLETDSPVCAPEKGARNEPANIASVVRRIAKIKNITRSEVIKITNTNVKELFGF